MQMSCHIRTWQRAIVKIYVVYDLRRNLQGSARSWARSKVQLPAFQHRYAIQQC